jgi:hypothetical protein
MLPRFLLDGSIPLPVLDGSQFWTDQLWRGGYRLQLHCWTGAWRLVSPRGIRCACGDADGCAAAFHRLAGDVEDCEDPPRHIAILLHGLLRTRRCMRKLERSLLQAGITTVIRFDYASTRQPIEQGAAGLRRLVEGLPANARISFVGHSMGNIVVRYAIGDWQRQGDPRGVLERLHRVVMLGPPNHGAAIARLLSKLRLFGIVVGRGGLELGPNWSTLLPKLAIPPCPFAILAGDLSLVHIRNPLIGPASDLLVSVDEARLEEATTFATMPIAHLYLMTSKKAIDFVKEIVTQPLEPRPRPSTARVAS